VDDLIKGLTLPVVLSLIGAVFVLLGIASNVQLRGTKINLTGGGRGLSVVIGIVLILLGVSVYALPEAKQLLPTPGLTPTNVATTSSIPVVASDVPTLAASDTPTSLPILIPTPTPGNLLKYFPFDTSVGGWEDLVTWDSGWQNPRTAKNAALLASSQIGRGVAYTLPLRTGEWTYHTVQYTELVQADVIVAHLYLPDTTDIVANWVGIAAARTPGIDEDGPWLASSGGSIPKGEWTQVVLDLRDKYDSEDRLLKSRPVTIQAVYLVQGNSTLSSGTTVGGLDDVACYRSETEIEVSVRDQHGPGRTLFDFEQEYPQGWEVSSQRVQTDTLAVSSEAVFRGRRSLKLDTQIAKDGNSKCFFRYEWTDDGTGTDSPITGLVAHIYLPAGAPTDLMWANLFSDTDAGWDGSSTSAVESGAWTTLVWDTRDVDWGEGEIAIGIQVGIEGGSYDGPIYVDDIQVFEY